jgi:ribosome-associated translation inhibitor RaiA
MGIEQLLNIAALASVAWSVVIYVPRSILTIYKQADSYKDAVNASLDQLDRKIEMLDVKVSAKEIEISHRLDLHIQQTLMSLDRINDSIVTMSNTLHALHKRLDHDSYK